MNDEVKNKVIELLKTTPERLRTIDMLYFEYQNSVLISPDEMLEAMAYAHGEGGGFVPGTISDKTVSIALNYEEKAAQANEDAIFEIQKNLVSLYQVQRRLDKYISLLTPICQELIHLRFYQRQPWKNVASQTELSPRAAQRHMKKAVDDLCEMYSLTDTL